MWQAQAKEVEAIGAAEKGAVKQENMADADHAATSANAESEPAASSAPEAAPGKPAGNPGEVSVKVRGSLGLYLPNVLGSLLPSVCVRCVRCKVPSYAQHFGSMFSWPSSQVS